MKYAKGIMWLDDCRIPFTTDDTDKINFDRPRLRNKEGTDWILSQAMDYTNPDYKEYNTQGRFTPNLLVCDDLLNDGSISKAGEYKGDGSKSGGIWNSSTGKPAGKEYGDKGTNSRYYDLDKWFNKVIDEIR